LLKTKSIYEPGSPNDGLKVLVTRYWPRGIKKERVDLWVRELGPSERLIKDWKAGKITWQEFKRRYIAEFGLKEKQKSLEQLKETLKDKDATLLCICEEENRCHRGILKELLTGQNLHS